MLKNIKRILLLVLILLLVGCGSSKTPELDFKEKELMVNVGETFVLEPIIIEAEDTTPIEYTFDKNGIIEYISGNSFKAITTGTVEITACLKEYETEAVSIKVTVIVDKYIVKFIDNNGNVLKTEAVSYGEAATAPGAPSVEGYNFVGWDKEFNNVTSDLEVKALYEKIEIFTVNFIDKNGNILKSEKVEKGGAATAPTAPSVDGYLFKGWDKEFNNVTSDLEVKAVYEASSAEKFIVKFIDKDGKVLKTEEVEKGGSATAPSIVEVSGYKFIGWDKEFNNITSDLEVKALYEETKVLATELELLNEFNVFKLKVGDTIKLEWKVLPSEASQQVSLVSLDSGVASVLDDGTVVAISGGNTSIIIKTIDGSNLEQTIEIYVEKAAETEKPDEESPEFALANGTTERVRLNWNTKFDPLAGVTASDNIDGDLTSKIEVTHNVDNRTYGTYEVKYQVKDKAGNTAEMTRYVDVVWDYAVEFIGHAGSYYGAMNSEEAILYAITKLKYTCVEIDLKSTKDGVFVLSHDDTFGGISIASTNWADLKDVVISSSRTAGYPFQNGEAPGNGKYTAKLCTLDRFLEICKQYGTKAVIELKGSPGITNSDQSKMPALMTAIKNKGMLDQVIFLASAYNCLIWTRNNGYGDIPCQYLVSSIENEAYLKRCIDYKLDISTNTTYGGSNSDEWIARYKEAGIKISTYTYTQYVDYPEVQKWIDKGVDFVTCDWHSMDKLKLPVKVDESLLPTYTVTFKDYDGTVLKTVSVKEGKTAAAPTTKERIGYEFVGWDKAVTNVKSDLVVTAKYDKLTYTIKYVNTLSSVTVEEWPNKEAFGTEFYSDYYNWLLTKAGILSGITKNGNTITITKNGKTVSFSSAADILKIDIYDFELTLSNYIYKPVTRLSDGTCVIEPSEDYFLNSDAYREKYKEVDQMLYRGIKNRYTSYDATYTPTSAGKIQIFFRFHQWLQGKATINEFLPLAKKYIVTDSGIDVTMPTTPSSYDVDSEITLPTPTSTLEFLGWYTNANFTGSPITKISKGSTGNLVLYAKWKTE